MCSFYQIKVISIDAIANIAILIILFNAYSDGIEQKYNANKSQYLNLFNHYNYGFTTHLSY